MQVATVQKPYAGKAEITWVRGNGQVNFRFNCSECGETTGNILLARVVRRSLMVGMLQLAVDAHLRTHS